MDILEAVICGTFRTEVLPVIIIFQILECYT